MSEFLSVVFGFPTAVFTSLLLVVLGYWLLAMFGAVDIGDAPDAPDVGDVGDATDVNADDLGALAGYLVAFGLNGVPISVVASLLVLVSWALSALASIWLVAFVPTTLLKWVVGAVVLLLSVALAIVITARLIRPLRGAFRTHYAVSHASLVGQSCKIWTSEVTPTVGRAEVAQRGAPLNIRVWADVPNPLRRGDAALIIDYDPNTQRYQVAASDIASEAMQPAPARA